MITHSDIFSQSHTCTLTHDHTYTCTHTHTSKVTISPLHGHTQTHSPMVTHGHSVTHAQWHPPQATSASSRAALEGGCPERKGGSPGWHCGAQELRDLPPPPEIPTKPGHDGRAPAPRSETKSQVRRTQTHTSSAQPNPAAAPPATKRKGGRRVSQETGQPESAARPRPPLATPSRPRPPRPTPSPALGPRPFGHAPSCVLD